MSWNYNEIRTFINDNPRFFNNDKRIIESVSQKAYEIIEEIPLNHSSSGTQIEGGQENEYSCSPQNEKCLFLNELLNFIPEGTNSTLWMDYISKRTNDDLLIMFEHNVIKSLPENIVEDIINAISLEDYTDKICWYSKPSLENLTHAKVLETTTTDLFPLIARRLLTLELVDDKIPLAVLLTELMTANKPRETDYNYKNWGFNFTNQLRNLRKTNNISPRLTVILWAIHSETTTSSNALSEVFPYLPPYLQIRIVKKLFKTISEGKISHTAESLYKLLSDGRKICFPLEITLTYLKLREKDPTLTLDNNIMLQLLKDRNDADEWIGIRSVLSPCIGRWTTIRTNLNRGSFFNGIIKEVQIQGQSNQLRVYIPKKMIDEYGILQDYNNKFYNSAKQLIKITFKDCEYQIVNEQNGTYYYFDKSYEAELFAIARPYNFMFNDLGNNLDFDVNDEDQKVFCECRLSDKVDNYHSLAFYWCGNKPCFRSPIRYHLESEWEHYTILDFMRILNISPDYISKNGKRTKFGHYIILSSYLNGFAIFYEHLKCRACGKLMRPTDITNFASRAVTEFSCENEYCQNQGYIVYLNHCFNKQKCKAIIDSRDSKQCPNEQYICPKCGACCSTENFRLRINNLHMTGGYISDRLRLFVDNNLGHWEKNEYFCYKCGKMINNNRFCSDCNVEYQ